MSSSIIYYYSRGYSPFQTYKTIIMIHSCGKKSIFGYFWLLNWLLSGSDMVWQVLILYLNYHSCFLKTKHAVLLTCFYSIFTTFNGIFIIYNKLITNRFIDLRINFGQSPFIKNFLQLVCLFKFTMFLIRLLNAQCDIRYFLWFYILI